MIPFTDLPTELLLEIISYFDPDSYTSRASLALTCRRFYDVFLPGIHAEQIHHFKQLLKTGRLRMTERRGAPMKGAAADLPPRSTVADPLSTSIMKLHFVVDGSEKELDSVLGVISRAPYLEEVHLELGYLCGQRKAARAINVCVTKAWLALTISGMIPSPQSGPFKHEILSSNTTPVIGRSMAWPELRGPLKELTKAKASTNPYLESFLAIFTRPFFKSSKQPQVKINTATEIGAPGSPQFTVSSTLLKPKTNFRRSSDPQLSSFSIQTDALFLPSLYPVTLNVLNNSPIHTLSLTELSLISYDWARILPSITMHVLKSLSINSGITIPFPDLLAFLCRHRSIENLDLSFNDIIGVVDFPPDIDILPRLTSLTAHSGYLVPFLQHKKAGHFPSLQSISVQDQTHDLDPFYRLLSESGFEDFSITFNTVSYFAFIAWLLNADKRPLLLTSITSLCASISRETGNLLHDWAKAELDKWAMDNITLVENSRRRKKCSSLMDNYLEISEAFICYKCPSIKNVVYRFDD